MTYYHKNKKGQMSHLVNLILIIAGAIIILMFIAKLFPATNYTEAINICRLSVLSQAATELQPTISGKKSPLDIKCEKRYVTFHNTKVELGLNPENMKTLPVKVEGKEVNKFRSLSDHAVNQVIAEELRICKYQFGDGKLEVFSNDESVLSQKNVCFICTEINFKQEGIDEDTFDTLLEYTQKTTINDEGLTYYDYLAEESVTRNIMWWQPTYIESSGRDQHAYMLRTTFSHIDFGNKDKDYSNLIIDKTRKYYVFFEKYNPAILGTAKEENKDITLTDPWRVEQYWIAIVPAEDINIYCDLQAN